MGTLEREVMVCRGEGFCHLKDLRRKNAVIASAAKQSGLCAVGLDCFVADAPRNDGVGRALIG